MTNYPFNYLFAQTNAIKQVNFSDPCRAGDINFREITANDINANKVESVPLQHRFSLSANLQLALGHFCFCDSAADCHIAAKFIAGGNTVNSTYGLAIQQY